MIPVTNSVHTPHALTLPTASPHSNIDTTVTPHNNHTSLTQPVYSITASVCVLSLTFNPHYPHLTQNIATID
jgi:hypothetical protein